MQRKEKEHNYWTIYYKTLLVEINYPLMWEMISFTSVVLPYEQFLKHVDIFRQTIYAYYEN